MSDESWEGGYQTARRERQVTVMRDSMGYAIEVTPQQLKCLAGKHYDDGTGRGACTFCRCLFVEE